LSFSFLLLILQAFKLVAQGDLMANSGNKNLTTKETMDSDTPITILWDGILLIPVVGPVDSLRANRLMEDMLERIPKDDTRIVILDILGVLAVDSSVANHLLKMSKASRLMGCEFIISGISPAIAQSMVQLGIDLRDIDSTTTVKGALELAFDKLKLEVKPR
jgi:rsbT co-antagonist protein RsbR